MSNKSGPTLSVLFLAFNQAAFVEEAAMSVLNQRCPEPIEILLSDDASDDATFKILQTLVDRYRGPHDVRLFRNQQNLGIGAHFNSLIKKSTGQLLISAAGDDISVPNRIHRVLQAWEETNRRVDLIASDLIDLGTDGQLGRVIQVDDLSKWRNASEWALRRPFVAGAGQAFTRRLCNQFGEFLPNVVCEDQVNTLRAILGGGAVTISEPLVQYRRGGISSGSATSDAASFLAKARVRHQRDLAEIQQMLQDAALMGEAKNIRNALEVTINRAELLGQLLDPPEQQTLGAVFNAAKKLPLSWCLRQYIYLRWPAIGALANRNKVMRSAARQAVRDRMKK
jgi:hypothetical protein